MEANASETELTFSEICCRGDRKGVMNEMKALDKKIKGFCKSKNLALIRHSDVNQNWQRKNYTYMKK